jgi:hypothetical protein
MTGTGLAVVRNTAIAPALSFGDMMDMGEQLVRTGFLPAHLRTGAQVAAVILTGRELGMEPMRAVRSLSLVKGKVVEAADSQLARFKADGGRATFKSLTEMEAVLWLRHPNGDEHTESFTMQDARNAGLASNDNYKKFPKAMLRSRVITAALKSVGWEGAVGNYDPDELAVSGSAPVGQAEYVHAETVEPAQLAATADGPTEKQAALLDKLLRSHVFTASERAKVAQRVTTKQQAKAAIDWATAQIAERKSAEAAQEADDEPDVELLDGSAPILEEEAA